MLDAFRWLHRAKERTLASLATWAGAVELLTHCAWAGTPLPIFLTYSLFSSGQTQCRPPHSAQLRAFLPLWLSDFSSPPIDLFRISSNTLIPAHCFQDQVQTWHGFQNQSGNNLFILLYICQISSCTLYCSLTQSLLFFNYDLSLFHIWANITPSIWYYLWSHRTQLSHYLPSPST